MNKKHVGIIRIVHALIFAPAILISARLLSGTGHQQTTSTLIIALWFASSLLIPGTCQSIKCEWACIRRFFGSTTQIKKE